MIMTTEAELAPLTLFDGDRCAACAGPIERAATGRPATYCSNACRKNAFRAATKPDVAPASTPPLSPGESLRIPTAPAALAAIAAAIATPSDAYGPMRAYCEVRGDGFGVVFGRDGGRVNEPAGPEFRRPRQGIDLADLLNTRLVDLNLIPNTKLAAAHVIAAAKAEVGSAVPKPPD